MMIQICQYVKQQEPGEGDVPGAVVHQEGVWIKRGEEEEEEEEEEEGEEEALESRQWETETAL